MLSGLRLSDRAKADIEEIWVYTARRFGMDQADAYDTLLWQALRDIRDEPLRPSSQHRNELGAGFRSYHIDLSKYRSEPRVKSPRHVIHYKILTDGTVEAVRILHDAMKPNVHLDE